MEIKSIRLEELPILLNLMRAMQEEDPWSVPFEEDQVRETLKNLLANREFGQGWFVAEGQQIIGYIVMAFDYSLEYGGRNAWVDEFYIEKNSRGRGIGAQVLDFFERTAQEAGATAVHLEVNQGNKAIDPYRRRGFEDHHRYLMTKWPR